MEMSKGRILRSLVLSAALAAPLCGDVLCFERSSWEAMERSFAFGGVARPWEEARRSTVEVSESEVVFRRNRGGMASATAVFDVDLGRTPWLRVETGRGNAHWRLTAQAVGPKGKETAELVAADHQTEGICERNIAELLEISGSAKVRLRFVMWGWGVSGRDGHEADQQELVLRRVEFARLGRHSDASGMSGIMKERHERVVERARGIRPLRKEHPSLRYREEDREKLIEKARTTHEVFVRPVLERIDNLEELKREEPLVLTPELVGEGPEAWRSEYIRLIPPETPELGPGEGWSPFEVEGMRISRTWRQMAWHFSSAMYIASALDDDPFWVERAKDWALAMAEWRFWKRASHVGKFFDFTASYPLQNMAYFYDIARSKMSEAEREKVREAMAHVAGGLYLNTLTGHGSIYNDLRGNHTGGTMCGLGMAGLVLLGEHPEAPLWVAKAEEMMLASFDSHESGAWFESPSYGAYGVNEWLRFAGMLRNVTGRDHLRNPFLRRFADFQLMISDWEGRDLGYNGGGAGQYWNQWIFLLIAREFRCPETQWLAEAAFDYGDSYMGYGDAFWWADPGLRASRPEARKTGHSFRDVGINVWRDSWAEDATILLHQCGTKGQHHQANQNHITLYANGERILQDGLGHQARHHNLPLVGEAGQERRLGAEGETLRFHTDEAAGYSLGDARGAYRGARQALRHVMYLREGAVAIIDEIGLTAANDVTLQLHPSGFTRLAGVGAAVDLRRARLLAAFSDFEGAVSRPEAGAFEGRSDRATHSVKAMFPGEEAMRMVTLLRFGARGDVPAEITGVGKRDGCIEFTAGGEIWRVGFGGGEIAPGFRADAPLWFALVKDGAVKTAMAIGGDSDVEVSLRTPRKTVSGKGFAAW